jgi:phosphoserine phosphatase RsbU/P
MNVQGVDVAAAAMSFAPDAQAPRLARRFVGDALSGRTDEGSVEVARLLVSELVTNAVVHAASAVEVEVAVDEAGMVVRVRDADTGPLVSRAGGGTELDEGGRGFMLVDRLAHTWGTEHSGGRKTVWFRLEPDGEPATERADAPIAAPDAEPAPARARQLLRTLVMRPNVQVTLTLREQIAEVLARVVDASGALAATVELMGEPEPLAVGAVDGGATTTSYELVVDDRRFGDLTVDFASAVDDETDGFLRLSAD